MDFLRTSLANGVTQISSLYQKATSYIMKTWLGLVPKKFGKRSIDDHSLTDEGMYLNHKKFKDACDLGGPPLTKIYNGFNFF